MDETSRDSAFITIVQAQLDLGKFEKAKETQNKMASLSRLNLNWFFTNAYVREDQFKDALKYARCMKLVQARTQTIATVGAEMRIQQYTKPQVAILQSPTSGRDDAQAPLAF